MEINNLKQKYSFIYLYNNSSFLIKLTQIGHIWLINCFEGCQHVLLRKKIKVNQIKKIIITNNNIKNVGGLLGLLSSISLNTNINKIDIYGPEGIYNYLFLGRKYSYTSFRYKMYFHSISTNMLMRNLNFSIYALASYSINNFIDYYFISAQQSASFNLGYALAFKVPSGPLFALFKAGKNFILPDGIILYSYNFISGYYLGSKVIFTNRQIQRNTLEKIKNFTYLLSF